MSLSDDTNPFWKSVDPRATTSLGGALQHPSQVGPYRILSALGEGGMGTVYAAEQVAPVNRRVALKLIKLGMDTREVIARFEAERQALALMDHPNIARVLDAGATDAASGYPGRPYFVMELVEGIPLTSYCDEHSLSTARRLELFVKVCDAVQHAHTKGVIHRDIKPGNVLVTEVDGKPVPKVIDFGVAKAVSQRLTERTLYTEFGVMVGTPEYMSPEQADSHVSDVDARTDVYSLGVMLYELLTGTLPFDPKTLRAKGYSEVQRIIREVEPPRPSTQLTRMQGSESASLAAKRRETAATLASALRRELEWIPLKAMRKERDHRYRTVSEFADDVRNYLIGKPLIAGPETRRYLAKKFLHRHRTSVAITVGMLVLLIGGAAATTWQAIRATRAERTARHKTDEAQRRYEDVRSLASRLLLEVLPDVSKYPGATPLTRKIVDMSLQYLSNLQAESSGDLKLMQDVTTAYAILGDVQGNPNMNNLGDVPAAALSYQKALDMAQRAVAMNPTQPRSIGLLSTAELKMGDILDRQGMREQADRHYQSAYDLSLKAAALDPEAITSLSNPLVIKVRLATQRLNSGDVDGALAMFKENVEAAKALVRKFPDDDRARDILPATMQDVARTQVRAGRYQDAVATLRDEVALIDSFQAAGRDDANSRRALAQAELMLSGVLLERLMDLKAAAGPAERAVALLQHEYDADPTNNALAISLAAALNSQYAVFLTLDQLDNAEHCVERAIELYRKSLLTAPSDRNLKQNLIVAYESMANVSERRKDFAGALRSLHMAMDVLQPLVAADPKNTTLQAGLAFTHRQISGMLLPLGDSDAAQAEAREAIAIFERLAAESPDDVRNDENLIFSRGSLINALSGTISDPKTPLDRRATCRAEGLATFEKIRESYLRLQKRGALTPELSDGLAQLSRDEKEFDDQSAAAVRPANPPSRAPTTAPATTAPAPQMKIQ